MNTRVRLIGLVILPTLLFTCPFVLSAVDVNNPPQGTFSDEWYAVMFNGKKSGSMHSVMKRVNVKGKDVIRTTTQMSITAKRNQASITISVIQKSQETLDGHPLSFERTTKLGAVPMTLKGTVTDGKVKITSSQFGIQSQSTTYNLPQGAIMDWGAYREQVRHGLASGTQYELPLYEPSISPDKLSPMKVKVGEREELDLFGRKVQAVRTEQIIKMGGTAVENTTWMTDEGTAVRMQMSVLDMPIEIYACSKSVATAADDPAELMVSTLIQADRPFDRLAKQITYRLAWTGNTKDNALTDVPETAVQKIVEKKANSITLRIGRRSLLKPAQRAQKLSDKDREPYLAATASVNYKDPEVAKLAQQVVPTEKNPLKIAYALRSFVSGYLQHKNLNVGFASASEVARSKEGDCTEHGILLAALGRARGIPTRVVTGIVFADSFGGKNRVFVGHLWTQFYIDGEWYDLDAALEQDEIDPTHIALSICTASDNSLAELVNSIWLNMGKLKVAIVDDGTTTLPTSQPG